MPEFQVLGAARACAGGHDLAIALPRDAGGRVVEARKVGARDPEVGCGIAPGAAAIIREGPGTARVGTL